MTESNCYRHIAFPDVNIYLPSPKHCSLKAYSHLATCDPLLTPSPSLQNEWNTYSNSLPFQPKFLRRKYLFTYSLFLHPPLNPIEINASVLTDGKIKKKYYLNGQQSSEGVWTPTTPHHLVPHTAALNNALEEEWASYWGFVWMPRIKLGFTTWYVTAVPIPDEPGTLWSFQSSCDPVYTLYIELEVDM